MTAIWWAILALAVLVVGGVLHLAVALCVVAADADAAMTRVLPSAGDATEHDELEDAL